MKNNYLIISYYTDNYEEIAKKYLLPSLKKLGLEHDVQKLKDEGSWKKNVALKPKFILDMLDKHEKDIVFIDADATIEKFPVLFEQIPQEYDLSLHYLDWNTWYGKGNRKELLSGTLFLRNCSIIKELCKEWLREAMKNQWWEQRALEIVIKKYKKIKIYELPLEYIYINELPNGKKPLIKLEPIISHWQVSRKYRHYKNKERR